MINKEDITRNWLKRYTGTNIKEYGNWILLTNFQIYVDKFSEKFDVPIMGLGGAMTSATNRDGLSIINWRSLHINVYYWNIFCKIRKI